MVTGPGLGLVHALLPGCGSRPDAALVALAQHAHGVFLEAHVWVLLHTPVTHVLARLALLPPARLHLKHNNKYVNLS